MAQYRHAQPGNISMPTSKPMTEFDLAAMQAHAGDAAQLLKALANERRLQVLCLLADGERSVGEINELLDLSQSALSQHLAVLREEGLVRTRREAQTIYYALTPGPAAAVMQTLHAFYCAPAPTQAARRRA
jgi:ArsR family transcriptional regulator, virulence genes transcriptional regulator